MSCFSAGCPSPKIAGMVRRRSNILGLTSTGVNGIEFLSPGATIVDDGVEDTLFADLDWFFYDFAQDILGDTSEELENKPIMLRSRQPTFKAPGGACNLFPRNPVA